MIPHFPNVLILRSKIKKSISYYRVEESKLGCLEGSIQNTALNIQKSKHYTELEPFYHKSLREKAEKPLDREQISIVFSWQLCWSKRWKPINTESAEHCLNGFPSWFSYPSCFFFFQWFNSRFVVPYRWYLGTKHDWCEEGK